MKNSPVLIIAASFVTVAIIGAFVVLNIDGANTEPLVDFLTQKVVSAIAALAAIYAAFKANKIESNTNGTTTALTNINAAQSAALANSVPVDAVQTPAVVPAVTPYVPPVVASVAVPPVPPV